MAVEDASARIREASSLWGNSPQEAFCAILNNADKDRKAASRPVRTRGFVVVARNIESLQPVQEWCLEQTWNDCLTARYRIHSKPVFGTLLAAISDDSEQMTRSPDQASPGVKRHGSLLFKPSPEWSQVFDAGFFEEPASTSRVSTAVKGRRGELDPEHSASLVGFLGNASLYVKGKRLVLLAEVVGEPDPAEWEAAKSGLFPLLPERVGLVLSGAPEGFSLPDDDPHYLDLDLAGVETRPGSEASVYEHAALTSDRPTPDDRLGTHPYADALARFILHPGTTPLAVAIHAPWGKGKSSFMLFVEQSLLGHAAAAALGAPVQFSMTVQGRLQRPEGVGRKDWQRVLRDGCGQVVTVGFNAWRYQDSTQIWAGLASTITSRLEAALPWWRRLMTPLAYAWRNRRTELIAELLVPAAAAVFLLVLAVVGVPYLRDWLDENIGSNALARLLGVVPAIGALLGGFWVLMSRMRRVLEPVSKRVLTYIRRPDYREQMGYQHRVLDDLRFVVGRLRGDRPAPRVVVFIDDLDRCSDEKVMELLQAINLILGESDFYVFLGIDTKMIYRAIETHYASEGQSVDAGFAETYLQKIVQLPFHLPPTSPDQRAGFIAEMFSDATRTAEDEDKGATAAGPTEEVRASRLSWDRDALRDPEIQIEKPVEDTPTELRAFRDFQPYLQDNPRELKRLVNLHRFVKIVLKQEGRPPSEETQRKLVKWLVFCARWLDLCDDVLAHARSHPDSRDCIAEVLTGVDEALEFSDVASVEDRLTADDLAPDGPLAQAALISHLVVWEPARRRNAPVPQQGGSTTWTNWYSGAAN